MSQSPLILMIGPFPPPVHGVSMVNQRIEAILQAAGFRTERYNLGAGVHNVLDKGWRYWANRVTTFLAASLRIVPRAASGKRCVAYVSLSGGIGIWFDLVLLLLVTWFRVPVFIHHHGFSYLLQKRGVVQWIFHLKGRVTHIGLCAAMEAAMRETYGQGSHHSYLVLGNSWLLPAGSTERAPMGAGPFVLGHLSNLCRDKGLYTVFELFERLQEAGIDIELRLAGPIGPVDSERLSAFLARHGAKVFWAGPLYGAEKEDWYRGLDLFLLPSANEAYPLVIVEALSQGIPAFGTRKGCMPGLLSGPQWCFEGEDFVREAANLITEMALDPQAYQRARETARELFSSLQGKEQLQLQALMAAMRQEP